MKKFLCIVALALCLGSIVAESVDARCRGGRGLFGRRSASSGCSSGSCR